MGYLVVGVFLMLSLGRLVEAQDTVNTAVSTTETTRVGIEADTLGHSTPIVDMKSLGIDEHKHPEGLTAVVSALVGVGSLVVLVYTLRYAKRTWEDTHRQVESVTSTKVHLFLLQGAAVYVAPDNNLKTAIILRVQCSLGTGIQPRLLLKLWIGNNQVAYSGGGLYDGTEEWDLPNGEWTGVIEPGSAIAKGIVDYVGSGVNIETLLNGQDLPMPYRNLTMPEKIRAMLLVRYKDPATGKIGETHSMMYYLQKAEGLPLNALGNAVQTQAYIWVIDYQTSRWPKDAKKWPQG